MAVWGVGAYYKGDKIHDKTQEFINNECACIGWGEENASPIHQMLKSIKVGDIIYIKSLGLDKASKNKQIHIKAVGVVKDNKPEVVEELGTGIKVKWKEGFDKIISKNITPEMYRNNTFNNSLYEEYNKNIIEELINAIMK